MSTTTGGTLNLVKPALTDDHKVTIGTDLPANFQKIDDVISAWGNNKRNTNWVIDSNFQIAQAVPVVATVVTNPVSGTYPIFDMWKVLYNADAGVLPTTINHSQQKLTAGLIDRSFYSYRLNADGAGSAFGANSYYKVRHYIENGTRLLCGSGKKVTVTLKSFSTITGKKIGVALVQNYGTGGTPSTDETINGNKINLITTPQTLTATFTTNTLTEKTFGTNNDDYLAIDIYYQWGTSIAPVVGDTVAETFVGAGDIEISQVALYAGDIILELDPLPFSEELRRCQRYFQRWSSQDAVWQDYGNMIVNNGSEVDMTMPLIPSMRIPPTMNIVGIRGTDWMLADITGTANTSGTFNNGSKNVNYGMFYFGSGTYTAGAMYHIRIHTPGAIVADARF